MVDYMVGDDGIEKHPNDDESQDREVESGENTGGKETAEEVEAVHEKSSKMRPIVFLSGALILYFFLAVFSIDSRYVDFGDGNYLYLSWRICEGEVLYQDLPSPQPPLLLFLGAFLLSLLGGGPDPTFIRLWQVLQHGLTACCLFGIGWRIFRQPAVASLAAAIYLFLPEGVWWSMGYQSEPLLILLQSFGLLLFLTAVERDRPSMAIYGSALVSVLCCFTNMTALPYAALQWFFVWFRFRRFFIRYSLAFMVPGILFFAAMIVYSGGQYIEHVFFRQVGTYPTGSLSQMFNYFIGKFYVEGGDIIFWEGGFVLAALIGILMFANEDRDGPTRDYLIWWAVFSIGSIVFVTKGGTVEYIFTLGEPAVAVFSAFFFMTIWWASETSFQPRIVFRSARRFGQTTLVVCLLLPVLLMKPLSLLYMSFSNQPFLVYSKGVYEASGEKMGYITNSIQRICPKNKTLIAPPYYAFLAERKLAENSSSLFILFHAWFSEWEQLKQNESIRFDLPDLNEMPDMRDVEFENETNPFYTTQAVSDLARYFKRKPELYETYPTIALFLNMREQIRKNDVGLVVCNVRHFFFSIPPLHQAIRDSCNRVQGKAPIENREELIVFFTPR